MSGSQKILSRANSKFCLEDVDCVISSIKKEATPAPPAPRTAMTRSKSAAVKRKKGALVDDYEPVERQIQDCVVEQLDSLKQSNAEKLKQLQDEMKTSLASQEKASSKRIKEQEAEISATHRDLDAARSKAEVELDAATQNAKIWVVRSVMEARIKMAKEAEDPSFDMTKWDVAKWQEHLAALEEEASEGQAGSSVKDGAAIGGDDGGVVGDEGIDASLSPLS